MGQNFLNVCDNARRLISIYDSQPSCSYSNNVPSLTCSKRQRSYSPPHSPKPEKIPKRQ